MKLHTKILLGLALGAAAGLVANRLGADRPAVGWIATNIAAPVGQVFLRLLMMTVVPLILASVTLGVAGLGDLRHLGRVGARTMAFFLVSTVIAVLLGLYLVNLVEPGGSIDPELRRELAETYRGEVEGLQARVPATFDLQTFVQMIPRNPVEAAAKGDMLAVIVFALVFGAALTQVPPERAAPLLRLLETLAEVVLRIIDFAMRLAPYGVFALIFVVTSKFGWELLGQLGKYVAIVIAGLALHAGVTISVLVRVLGGLNPLVFWSRVRPSLVTGFSTSSSNATLPTNIAVAERSLGVPPHIAGFVLPLGATMNMNGTALYEGVTVLFLAQVFGVELSLAQQGVVLAMSVLTAIGAAGVPGGSLPLMMVVMGTVGVPGEAIAIILGVDRLLDMCRTTVNVTGDLAAAVYVTRAESRRPVGS